MLAVGDFYKTFCNMKIFSENFNKLNIRFIVFRFGAHPHLKKFVVGFDNLLLFGIGMQVDGDTHNFRF